MAICGQAELVTSFIEHAIEILELLIKGKVLEKNQTILPLHSQKRHRPVASCQVYRLAATCQVATSLSIKTTCNKFVDDKL